MEFRIERASGTSEKFPPIHAAHRKVVETSKKHGWKDESWVIDIKDLKELVEMCKESEESFIVFADDDEEMPRILIYDDYLE
jgi:hypothetical protein